MLEYNMSLTMRQYESGAGVHERSVFGRMVETIG
jgi:hypothetical protein